MDVNFTRLAKRIMHKLFLGISSEVVSRESLETKLVTLVSFKSISSNHQESLRLLDWIKRQLTGLPVYCKSYQSNGVPSLVVTTQATKAPKLWLMAHIDVAPADDKFFDVQHIDGKMYGRGVLDMKMAAAAYIQLFQSLGANLKDYDIGLMFTADEEIGGFNGASYLLSQQGYSGQFGLLPDGGYNWEMEENAKGVLWVKIISTGLSSHASRPWLGRNAINNLMRILTHISIYFDKLQDDAKDKNYYSTLNIGLIQGGAAPNQVPNHAQATMDIRYTLDFDMLKFKEYLNELLAEDGQSKYEIILECMPNHTDLNLPEIKLFKTIAKEMYGISVGVTQSHGASNARFFSAKNIPVLLIAPIGGEAHSPHEWLSTADFHRYYEVLKNWAEKVSKIGE